MLVRSLQEVNRKIEVSVVMSVYNGASNLSATIESILSQEGVAIEFIIVNDGSSDDTGEILDKCARRDSRVRVVHQQNTGLTRALIRGCGLATGEFIGRQDAGDVSLPGRLASQLTLLRNNPIVVMTSCGTRLLGPNSEVLTEISQVGWELQQGLQQVRVERIRGPSHHTSVMFRRKSFEAVGGYRSEFKVAQDLDLWIRLSEVGVCWATPKILCEAHLTKNSISASRRAEQIRSAKVIVKCAEARRSGKDETAIISKWLAKQKRQIYFWYPQRLRDARFYYFIGSLLRHRQPKLAQVYFWRAVVSWVAHPRAWYRILRATRRI